MCSRSVQHPWVAVLLAVSSRIGRYVGWRHLASVQWKLHRGVQLSCRIGIQHSAAVSSWAVQLVWSGELHQLLSGVVWPVGGDTVSGMQWSVSRWLLLSDPDVQWDEPAVSRGVQLSDRHGKLHLERLSSGTVQSRGNRNLHPVCRWTVRRCEWLAVFSVLRELFSRVYVSGRLELVDRDRVSDRTVQHLGLHRVLPV